MGADETRAERREVPDARTRRSARVSRRSLRSDSCWLWWPRSGDGLGIPPRWIRPTWCVLPCSRWLASISRCRCWARPRPWPSRRTGAGLSTPGAAPTARQLYVQSLDELRSRPLAGTTDARFPEFSPDGKWIAFVTSDDIIKGLPAEGGAVTTISAAPSAYGLTWLSNDTLVLFPADLADSRGFWRVGVEGGEPVRFAFADTAAGERILYTPRAANDGKLILYGSFKGSLTDSHIAVLSLATGKKRIYSNLPGWFPIGLAAGQLLYVRIDGTLMAVPSSMSGRWTSVRRCKLSTVLPRPTPSRRRPSRPTGPWFTCMAGASASSWRWMNTVRPARCSRIAEPTGTHAIHLTAGGSPSMFSVPRAPTCGYTPWPRARCNV